MRNATIRQRDLFEADERQTAPARVRIDRRPDRLPALAVRRQHVPVGRRLVDHARRGPVKADLVLTGAAVPDADRPLAAPLEIAPDAPLVRAWAPVVRDLDFSRHRRHT